MASCEWVVHVLKGFMWLEAMQVSCCVSEFWLAISYKELEVSVMGLCKHTLSSKNDAIFSAIIIFGKSDNWIIKWDVIWKCSHWTTQIRFQNLGNSFELWAVSRQRGYPSKSKSQNRFSQLNVALQHSVKDYKLNKGTWWKKNH